MNGGWVGWTLLDMKARPLVIVFDKVSYFIWMTGNINVVTRLKNDMHEEDASEGKWHQEEYGVEMFTFNTIWCERSQHRLKNNLYGGGGDPMWRWSHTIAFLLDMVGAFRGRRHKWLETLRMYSQDSRKCLGKANVNGGTHIIKCRGTAFIANPL